jgi:hypothetical protein
MTFIDQTIVALAIPELQKDIGLSATGTQIESSLTGLGLPQERADAVADSLSQSGGGSGGLADSAGRGAGRIFEAVQHDFAESMQLVFYAMAGVLVVCYVVAHLRMPGDRVVEAAEQPVSTSA